MNPLADAVNCTLYNSDLHLIADAKFSRQEDGTMTLILSKRPDSSFPRDFRLVPEDNTKHGGLSYLCTIPSSFSAYHVDTTGDIYYICEMLIQEALRIYVKM